MKPWQGAEERSAELVAAFKRGKLIEAGPSVDDFDPEPGVDAVCTPEHPCPKSLDPSGTSWSEGCWCYRNQTDPAVEARRKQFNQIMDRVVADNAETLKRLAMGPGVEDMGQQITDEINADPEEVEQLRQARVSARQGNRVPLREALADDDFFEEDEPITDVQAAWDAAEKQLTEPPADGTGWCAPSP